jgi:NADH:ubiquinone oxidoreductase subunit C
MTNEELRSKIAELLPSATYEEAPKAVEWITVNLTAADWLPFANRLRNDTDLWFDYLFCLTCVDWKTHLTMVYHLTSTRFRHSIVVKSKLERTKPNRNREFDLENGRLS